MNITVDPQMKRTDTILAGEIVGLGIRRAHMHVGDPTPCEVDYFVEEKATLPELTEKLLKIWGKDGDYILKVVLDVRESIHGRHKGRDWFIVLWPKGEDIV